MEIPLPEAGVARAWGKTKEQEVNLVMREVRKVGHSSGSSYPLCWSRHDPPPAPGRSARCRTQKKDWSGCTYFTASNSALSVRHFSSRVCIIHRMHTAKHAYNAQTTAWDVVRNTSNNPNSSKSPTSPDTSLNNRRPVFPKEISQFTTRSRTRGKAEVSCCNPSILCV